MADIERRVLRPNLMRDKDSDEEGPHPGDGPDSDFSDDDDGALDGVGASGGAGGAGEEMTVMPGATGLPEPVEDVAVGRHKTGPKGVIEDYRQHKRQERIKVSSAAPIAPRRGCGRGCTTAGGCSHR